MGYTSFQGDMLLNSVQSYVFADVLNPESITEAARMVEDQLNGLGLNLLINNAGVYSKVTLETVDSEEMVHAYKTNLVGPLLTAKVTLQSSHRRVLKREESGIDGNMES